MSGVGVDREDLGLHRKVQLVVSGGIRNGADVAKCLALGADAVSIGTAALVALGDNDPAFEADYAALGTTAGAYDDWPEGRDPAGVSQDPAAPPVVYDAGNYIVAPDDPRLKEFESAA